MRALAESMLYAKPRLSMIFASLGAIRNARRPPPALAS
jgi:hypothetical protein